MQLSHIHPSGSLTVEERSKNGHFLLCSCCFLDNALMCSCTRYMSCYFCHFSNLLFEIFEWLARLSLCSCPSNKEASFHVPHLSMQEEPDMVSCVTLYATRQRSRISMAGISNLFTRAFSQMMRPLGHLNESNSSRKKIIVSLSRKAAYRFPYKESLRRLRPVTSHDTFYFSSRTAKF